MVKAFNTLGANRFDAPDFGPQTASMFICGDDAEARSVVMGLSSELGFDVVDCGPLANAIALEEMGRLWVWLARNGYGRDIAYKLLRKGESPC